MISNPFLNAVIVFALCLVLAVLAGAVLYRLLSGQPNDSNLGMAILAILALLQGYVQIDRAVTTVKKNGNG